MYITPYIPGPIFHASDLHSWNGINSINSVGAKKVGVGKHSEDVSFDIGTVLVVEQSSLGNSPRRGVIDTVVYGINV